MVKSLGEQKIDVFCLFTKDMRKTLNNGMNRCKLAKVEFENEEKILSLFNEIEELIRQSVIKKAEELKKKGIKNA